MQLLLLLHIPNLAAPFSYLPGSIKWPQAPWSMLLGFTHAYMPLNSPILFCIPSVASLYSILEALTLGASRKSGGASTALLFSFKLLFLSSSAV